MDLVDVVNGDVAPLFVLSLIEGLPEGSKTAALMQDKEHWRTYLGITQDYYVLAGIFNAINGNTAATGNFKKRPKFDPWPTPGDIVKKRKPRTLADIERAFARK